MTLAAALCLPALFAQKSAAEEPIVLTFQRDAAYPPAVGQCHQAWCDELEKRSNGRIKIEPYFITPLASVPRHGLVRRHSGLGRSAFSSNPGAFLPFSDFSANPSMVSAMPMTMISIRPIPKS